MLPRSQENIRVENIRTENNNLNISVLRRQAEKDDTLLFYFIFLMEAILAENVKF